MLRQYELIERVKAYDADADEDAINRAYVYAMKAHGAQTRASGDPYFSHPLEVAGILTEYRLDSHSIITALLHDTLEDTHATYDEIKSMFGEDVARLVDGVTKLTRIEFQSDQAKQAENFRKLILAMSEDIRVLLIKLADRLHNMRTLGFVKNPEKRRRIAAETMDIYAPLAERVGMHEVKSELEDLAFTELNSEARDSIQARLAFLREQGGDVIPRITETVCAVFSEGGLEAEVLGREKTPYSIWRKMQRHAVEFEQLSDIMAFRVLVKTKDDCYRAMGLAHSAWAAAPGRFKDYISTPKPNGYQSLHTGLIGPERRRIELQIRTREMHETAEYGVAAHWTYKQQAASKEGPRYRWLRELLDILEHAAGPEEFLEHTKLEMFQDQVFCFTPRGDVISLPHGATPVDFAYAVHSEIGDHCVGAKINGRLAPLRAALGNGDQVEILTSKGQTPSPAWERMAVTGKARTRIRRFMRSQEREQYVQLGRSIIERAFKAQGYEFTGNAAEQALAAFNQPHPDDLAAAVGAGSLSGRAVLEAAVPGVKDQASAGAASPAPGKRRRWGRKKKTDSGPGEHAVSIKGLIPGMAMHMAECCHPLPGDRIVGIITEGRGVIIHTIDCGALEAFAEEEERWIDAAWSHGGGGNGGGGGDDNGGGGESVEKHVGRITARTINEPGSLGELAARIAQNKGNISNLVVSRRSPDFIEMSLDIEVTGVKHLTNIIAALRASNSVNAVERTRG
ncbi:MAG: RelA/SpoT family protein [Rhodospirillales bacterium]